MRILKNQPFVESASMVFQLGWFFGFATLRLGSASSASMPNILSAGATQLPENARWVAARQLLGFFSHFDEWQVVFMKVTTVNPTKSIATIISSF